MYGQKKDKYYKIVFDHPMTSVSVAHSAVSAAHAWIRMWVKPICAGTDHKDGQVCNSCQKRCERDKDLDH